MQWRSRAHSWEERGSAGLSEVVDVVLAQCGHMPDGVAVDLGCGSGQVTLPLARRYAHVLGVDISAGAIELLRERAAEEGVINIQSAVHPLETLDLPAGSVDLVVTNYALHHLRDQDKRRLVLRSLAWLRPGGRLVLGDLMLGRGLDPTDREIIRTKIRSLAQLGPSGWWRIAKNCFRFALRIREKPLSPPKWEAILREAGFVRIVARRVVAEACVMSATKPPVDGTPELKANSSSQHGAVAPSAGPHGRRWPGVSGGGWPKPAPAVRHLGRADVDAAVALYCEVMSDQFLASCGRAFLRRYFETWIESPAAIALVAVSDQGLAVAMLLGALDPAQHYRWMVRHGGGAMAARLMIRAIHRPRWGVELARTRGVRYLRGTLRMFVWTQRRRQRGVEVISPIRLGEITHLMVTAASRGHGLGGALLNEARRLAIAGGVERLVVVTPVGWTAAEFYTHLGWAETGEMVTRSDEHFLRFELALSSPD